MGDQEQLPDGLLADEAWLARTLHDSFEPDREMIQMRVGIELGEQWLGEQLPRESAAPQQLLSSVRLAVRNAISLPPSRGFARFHRTAVAMSSLAAALLITVIVWRLPASPTVPMGFDTGLFDDAAFNQNESFEADLALIYEDIDELDSLGVAFASSGFNENSFFQEELSADLNLLLAEMNGENK